MIVAVNVTVAPNVGEDGVKVTACRCGDLGDRHRDGRRSARREVAIAGVLRRDRVAATGQDVVDRVADGRVPE